MTREKVDSILIYRIFWPSPKSILGEWCYTMHSGEYLYRNLTQKSRQFVDFKIGLGPKARRPEPRGGP
jgi:hypothetical protein